MQRKTQCHSVLGDVFVGSTVGGRAGRTGGMFPGESLCPATLGMFPGSSERTFFPRMASTPWEILSYPRSPLKLEWLPGYSLLLLLSTFWTHQRECLCLVLWVSNTLTTLATLLPTKGAGLRPTPGSRLELHIIVFFPACLFSQFPSIYGQGGWGFHWQYSYKFPL